MDYFGENPHTTNIAEKGEYGENSFHKQNYADKDYLTKQHTHTLWGREGKRAQKAKQTKQITKKDTNTKRQSKCNPARR